MRRILNERIACLVDNRFLADVRFNDFRRNFAFAETWNDYSLAELFCRLLNRLGELRRLDLNCHLKLVIVYLLLSEFQIFNLPFLYTTARMLSQRRKNYKLS